MDLGTKTQVFNDKPEIKRTTSKEHSAALKKGNQ